MDQTGPCGRLAKWLEKLGLLGFSVAGAYTVLWTVALLLVKYCTVNGSYKFNINMAICCSEAIKFSLSLLYYLYSPQCVPFGIIRAIS
jgi:hypothetical protein